MIDLVATARALRAGGLSHNAIARTLGCSGSHIQRVLSPARPGGRRPPHRIAWRVMPDPAGGPSPADLHARRREMPDDTRGLTARLMGDPIPGDARRAGPAPRTVTLAPLTPETRPHDRESAPSAR